MTTDRRRTRTAGGSDRHGAARSGRPRLALRKKSRGCQPWQPCRVASGAALRRSRGRGDASGLGAVGPRGWPTPAPGRLIQRRAALRLFTSVGDWCNGSTTDSGSVSPGSNPGSPVVEGIGGSGPRPAGPQPSGTARQVGFGDPAQGQSSWQADGTGALVPRRSCGWQTVGRAASAYVFPPHVPTPGPPSCSADAACRLKPVV